MVKIIKRKLFIDVDGTITNTIKAICSLYNEDFDYHTNFKPAIWHNVETWNFSDECPLATKKDIYSYFDDPKFFERLEFMENAKEVLDRLSEKFDIYIVTLGTSRNLELKEKWFKVNLPYVNFIGCNTSKYKFKDHVNMSGGIFLDDRADNLENSNAEVKVVFGDEYEWNSKWQGKRCWNWYEVEKLLTDLINM